jgi:antitoxin (DNA-binding transcriptional repressor) of toxin-antitoxin stability system
MHIGSLGIPTVPSLLISRVVMGQKKTITVFGDLAIDLAAIANEVPGVAVHRVGVAALRLGLRAIRRRPQLLTEELCRMRHEREVDNGS